MKSLFVCLIIFVLNFNRGVVPFAIQINGDSGSRSCLVGLLAFLPDEVSPPFQCKDHEFFACGYSEARCDGRLFCGTPPCTWRCWCMPPFKRNANGKCVLWCPKVEVPLEKATESKIPTVVEAKSDVKKISDTPTVVEAPVDTSSKTAIKP